MALYAILFYVSRHCFVKRLRDPSCLGIEKNDEVNLDEKMLKNLALEKIEIPEGYQVKRQRVKKIYDEKPYYRVITYLENNYGFSVSKIFEYRLE